MIRRLVFVAVFVGAACAVAAAQHQVLPDFQADPSARVFHGKLYVYPSHDVAGSKDWDMVDWHAFSTDDMIHFKDHGVIFSLKDVTWANKHAWAPDCIERNGKYYFYFPADDQIGVAVSDSPTGPFKDALGKPLIGRNEAAVRSIDPNIFIDDDGQRCHHLIDPKTGRSPSSVHSVTILAEDGLTTEALSKTVFVSGLEKGLRLVESQEGVDAVVVDATGELHYSGGLLAGAAPARA